MEAKYTLVCSGVLLLSHFSAQTVLPFICILLNLIFSVPKSDAWILKPVKIKKAVFSSDAKHPDALVFVSLALLIDPSKSVLLA